MRSWAWASGPLVAIAALLILLPSHWRAARAVAYLIVLVLLALELVIIGYLVNGRPAGAFIDNRNRLSLSKIQAAAWTVVVLAGFATAAAFNAVAPAVDPSTVAALAITIPGELLLAMGIASTSLVATPALLSIKSNETPSDSAITNANAKLGAPVTATGKVLVKSDAAQASWADLVTGEEVGNAGSPDLGKIQQLIITCLLLGCYAGYVYMQLSRSAPLISTLPVIDKSFVWLLGISHASYLAYKAAPHTETGRPS